MQGGAPSPDAAAGRQLIEEVCEVVEANFTDARNAGFDPETWQQLKARALARPLRDRTAAYRWGDELGGCPHLARLCSWVPALLCS